MKPLFFTILIIGFAITSASAQQLEKYPEPFVTLPLFNSLQASVGRVQVPYKVSFRDCPKHLILPKTMTATEGVSIANFLIQSPRDFNLRRDVYNVIPTQTGAIFIRYISHTWEIGYQPLSSPSSANFLLADGRVFWLTY